MRSSVSDRTWTISGSDLRPQDLFSWSSTGQRNTTSSGTRYFSIDGGVTNIVNFNQDTHGDFGDWLSEECPQSHPYVQNAFACTGQFSDVSATSPEGINLDVIGYDLLGSTTHTVRLHLHRLALRLLRLIRQRT